MKKHLPNALTMANLFCGCCATVFVLSGSISLAAVFSGFSLILDWLDGTAARLLGVQSPLGKELDSLADVVSFGVVPGAILFKMLGGELLLNSDFLIEKATFLGFVLSAFSALRLAKFNLDTRQTDHFLGLATPACTIFVLGLGLAWESDQFGLRAILGSWLFIFPIIVLLSFLLISDVPMFALKLKRGEQASNLFRFFAIVLAAGAMLFFLKGLGLSLLIVFYVVGSVLFFRPKKA